MRYWGRFAECDVVLLQHVRATDSTTHQKDLNMNRQFRRRWIVPVLISVFIVSTYFVFERHRSILNTADERLLAVFHEPAFEALTGKAKPQGVQYTRRLVIGKLTSEETDWVDEQDLNVNATIYVVDDSHAENKVPKNKGREAMVYLTYIIDHYDDLADTTMFFHPHLGAWHNNVLLDLNGAMTIRRLSDARVAREGYMNARCHHDPGCPNWLHIDRPEAEWDFVKKSEEQYLTSQVWRELHGDAAIPPSLSQPCCAQFAVSRDRIRAHAVEEYIRYRDWLLATKLSDDVSGRIMEYTWQYIFTGNAEFCPPIHQCYCDGYGICFGGESKLQDWLDTLKQREEADEEVERLYKQAGKNSPEAKSAKRKSDDLEAELVRVKYDAYLRGANPKNRAAEMGREWHDGDGF